MYLQRKSFNCGFYVWQPFSKNGHLRVFPCINFWPPGLIWLLMAQITKKTSRDMSTRKCSPNPLFVSKSLDYRDTSYRLWLPSFAMSENLKLVNLLVRPGYSGIWLAIYASYKWMIINPKGRKLSYANKHSAQQVGDRVGVAAYTSQWWRDHCVSTRPTNPHFLPIFTRVIAFIIQYWSSVIPSNITTVSLIHCVKISSC